MFPHIAEAILRESSWEALVAFRGTSRNLAAVVDNMMAKHIALNYHGNAVHPDRPFEIKTPLGQRIPCLQSQHQVGLQHKAHGTTPLPFLPSIVSLQNTQVIDLVDFRCSSTCHFCVPGQFDNVKYVRLYQDVITAFPKHLHLEAPIVVIFCDLRPIKWMHEEWDGSYYSEMEDEEWNFDVIALPIRVPSKSKKLVINLRYQTSKGLRSIDNVPPEDDEGRVGWNSLTEVVIIFTSWNSAGSGESKAWRGMGRPSWYRLNWLARIVFHLLNYAQIKLTIVDFEKVDSQRLFKQNLLEEGQSNHSALVTHLQRRLALHPESEEQLKQRLHLAIESIEFLTIDEYAERLDPGDLELETEATLKPL